MPSRIRLTMHVAAVLSVLTANPGRRLSATQVAEAASMVYVTAYGILQRLHEAGFASVLHNGHSDRGSGQSSNFYLLSPYGHKRAESLLQHLRNPAEALYTWQADDLEIPDDSAPRHRHLTSVG